MYIEDQYIQEQFRKNFLDGSARSIIIYGTGIHTEKLLQNISDQRIAGLMDVRRTGETLWGKRVLSYEEAAKVSNACIVIIARNAVIHVIYQRIEGFVKKHAIPVFDINGNLLTREQITQEKRACFSLDKKEFERRMAEADVISFDIFDTLLCRRVMRPADVFRLMDTDLQTEVCGFSDLRIKAEGSLEGKHPTIYEIYERFLKYTSEIKDTVKDFARREIEIEKKVLQRRESMCQLLGHAVKLGKKVILISDMYFTKEIMEEILSHFHIAGYDRLYISCEHRCSKTEGLFDAVRQREDIKGSWLHIGDNAFADILVPEKIGIRTCQVYSTMEMLEQSIYAHIVELNRTLEENVGIASFAAEAFNDPFGSYAGNGKLSIGDERKLAMLVIAPVIFKYMVWLVQKLIDDSVELVLFPSRDGFLLKKIYDDIRENYGGGRLPESVYFYTSRRAALVAAAKDKEEIRFIAELDAPLSLEERIRKRFGVKIEEKFTSDEVPEHVYKELLERSQWERETYLRYIKSCGYFDKERVALVDFVSIGTVHEALQRLTEKEIKGYYFLRRMPDTKQRGELDCSALYGMFGDFQMDANLYRFYYFMEAVLSSDEPSFQYIKKDGTPCFYKECRSLESIRTLENMHDAICQYCKKQVAINPHIGDMRSSVDLYDTLLGFFSSNYSEIPETLLKDLINVDEFLEKKVADINR